MKGGREFDNQAESEPALQKYLMGQIIEIDSVRN
jgi:hypothetical protein